jgi:hypothetical protein
MNISLSHCFNSVRDSDEALKLDCAFRHPSGNSTPDLAGTFDRVQATGADVVQEPMDQSYGRDCAFRDPAGNMIRIIQTRGSLRPVHHCRRSMPSGPVDGPRSWPVSARFAIDKVEPRLTRGDGKGLPRVGGGGGVAIEQFRRSRHGGGSLG